MFVSAYKPTNRKVDNIERNV